MVTVMKTTECHVTLHRIKPRNQIQPLSCYHTLKISRIVQGRGVWSIGRKQYQIVPGDLYILNNSEYRAIHTVHPPEELVMQVIDFEPRFIWSNHGDLLDISFLNVFFSRPPEFENRLSYEGVKEITSLMENVAEELAQQNSYCLQMAKVKLMNILVLLNRYYFPRQQADEQGLSQSIHQSVQAVNLIINHIKQHLTEDISLQQLSQLVHLNPSYVSRIFKKYNGLNLAQYIQKLRIEKTVAQLQETDKTIWEIALDCGFNSSSNFYKAFRSITGKSPQDFRMGKNDVRSD